MDDNHLQMPFTFDYYSPSYTLRLDEEHMDKVPYILQQISSACDLFALNKRRVDDNVFVV